MTRTIAYVDHADQVGGAEKSLCELVAHLDRKRWEPVIVHHPDARWLRYAKEAGVQLRADLPPSKLYATRRGDLGVGVLASLKRLFRAAPVVRGIARAIRSIAPTLVHTNSTKMHLMAGGAARIQGVPVIWHMRDLLTEPDAHRWLRRAVDRVCPEVIAISHAVATQFEGMPCRVHVIPNGVPLDRFRPGNPPEGLREELELPPGSPVACIVGRLTPWKGHRTLLRAWRRVLREIPEAHLLIIGEVAFWDGGYEDELRSLAQMLEIGDSVRWTRFREDVPDLLRLSDLLVLASEGEPFGRVLIEAMATGLPIVGTASGGVPEIVIDGETGLLVPTKAPDVMADALVELLSAPPRAREMGAAGRLRACEHFDIRRVTREVEEVYESILGA